MISQCRLGKAWKRPKTTKRQQPDTLDIIKNSGETYKLLCTLKVYVQKKGPRTVRPIEWWEGALEDITKLEEQSYFSCNSEIQPRKAIDIVNSTPSLCISISPTVLSSTVVSTIEVELTIAGAPYREIGIGHREAKNCADQWYNN